METRIVSNVDQKLDPEVRSRLLDVAREHFFRYGFSRVTMDEVAEDAGVSKKTYYRYFPSKEALVRAAFTDFRHEERDAVGAILDAPGVNYSTKLIGMLASMAKQLAIVTPAALADLRRGAPSLWREIEEFRRQMIQEGLGARLREGMREGCIRRDLESFELVLVIYVQTLERVLTPELLERLGLTYGQAFSTLIKVTMGGLLTDKGRAELGLSTKRRGRRGTAVTRTGVQDARVKRRRAR
ncbi:TetR/AcrR family transcriptional regulator [candidate division WOR-3 bacterium]|nr:TetR/AcrR family transcriptional regulator [candidate division WOR-3 bacterium]